MGWELERHSSWGGRHDRLCKADRGGVRFRRWREAEWIIQGALIVDSSGREAVVIESKVFPIAST